MSMESMESEAEARVSQPGFSALCSRVAPDLVGRLMTELVGTFFVCFAVSTASGDLAAISIGGTLMVMTFAGSHVSGAHYNPAVTLGVYVRGALELPDALLYCVAQVAGSFLAGGFAYLMTQNDAGTNEDSFGYPSLGDGVSLGQAYLAEIIMTFALTYTQLHVATTRVQADNSYFALAVGFTMLSGCVSVGGISGGAFNPAAGLLPAIVRETKYLSVYILGPLCGGLLAGLTFRLIMPAELPEGTFLSSLGRNDTGYIQLSRKCLVEFIGTFYLCFTVACTGASSNGSILAPLAIGSILIGQFFAGGAVSGANYNPAVTFALYVRSWNANFSPACKKLRAQFSPCQIVSYLAAQFLGSLCGGGMARAVYGDDKLNDYASTIGFPAPGTLADLPGRIVLGELIGTFALIYVILHVATHMHTSGNSFFGLAIGFTVTSMVIAIGPKTGAAFNPAVGILTVAAGADSVVWVYFVGPLLGAFLAGLFFRLQCFGRQQPQQYTPKERNRFMYHAVRGSVVGAYHSYFPTAQEFQHTVRASVRETFHSMFNGRSIFNRQPLSNAGGGLQPMGQDLIAPGAARSESGRSSSTT